MGWMNSRAANAHVLRTALSPEQCHDHLVAHLYVYRPFRWGSRARHPVRGQVSPTGFSLRQRTFFTHTLTPVAVGTFERTADGTRVTVCWSGLRRLSVLWLGAGAAALLLAVVIFAPSPADVRLHGFFALAPFIGFVSASLGNLILAGFVYVRRLRRQRTFFRQFLRVQLHAEDDSVI